MNLLEHTLAQIPRAESNKDTSPALMTHVVLGYPTLEESLDVVRAMAENGARIIELQIPFSDPTADGPTIMEASEEALAQGMTPLRCMKAMERLSSELEVPLLFMSYFNLLYAYGASRKKNGLEAFLKDAASAGASGLIVPDVPVEESGEGYWTLPQKHGLTPIPLVSPVSGEERLKKISAKAKEGFVYCVSTTGTTGARKSLAPDLAKYLKTVGRLFSQPRAVGFGISTPEQIRALSGCAEIAIVGSAMIDVIRKTKPYNRLSAVSKFTKSLARA